VFRLKAEGYKTNKTIQGFLALHDIIMLQSFRKESE
jgi:hypothetical protein